MAEVSSPTLPMPEIAAHFLLRRDIAFLNHGSFGACPRPVFEAYQRWQRIIEDQPVEFFGRRISGLLAEARARLASFIGAAGSEVVFVPNVTYAMNIVARSIDLQPGDEVLGTGHEYGAVERAWRYVCEQRGAIYVPHPIHLPVEQVQDVEEQIWSGVSDRTKVITLSHITSPTALVLPVAAICRRARAAGIISVVDGAHAPGQIDLDMQAIGADFYGGNCHKWLCAPKGAGFLYARPDRQTMLEPLIVSWGWRAREPGGSTFLDYYEWMGTDDPSAFLSVPAAIDFQTTHDWPAVRQACHTLLAESSQRMAGLTRIPALTPETTDWWVQMRALPLPPCDPQRVQARLWDEFQVEVPCFEWNGVPLVRISIQAYNSPEDVDRLLLGLQAIMS